MTQPGFFRYPKNLCQLWAGTENLRIELITTPFQKLDWLYHEFDHPSHRPLQNSAFVSMIRVQPSLADRQSRSFVFHASSSRGDRAAAVHRPGIAISTLIQ